MVLGGMTEPGPSPAVEMKASGSGAGGGASSSSGPSATPRASVAGVEQLMSLGFSEVQASNALRQANGDLSLAASLLMAEFTDS